MTGNKLDVRAEAMITLASEFQKLMEQNDSLRALIEAASEEGTRESLEEVKTATYVFKCHAAQMIGSLAMVCGHIDNTSASKFLHDVSSQFTDYTLESDPFDILKGLIES